MAHDQSVRSDRRLRELLDLLARKNASPSDAAVESQFYNDLLAYLLTSSSPHWWCTEAENTIAQESLWLFSLPDHESIQKYKQKLAEQLSSCVACVEQYHLSKPSLRERYLKLFSVEDVVSFFSILHGFDKERILSTLRRKSLSRRDNPTQPATLDDELISLITDVAYSPDLLRVDNCDALFCEMFDNLQKIGHFPVLNTTTANGLIILAFHHHRIVRLWARKLLEKFASEKHTITELKEDVQPIMEWMTADGDEASSYPTRLARDLSDRWKAFRATMGILSQEKARSLINIPFSRFLQQQLLKQTAPIPEIIKSLPDLTRKLGEAFWDLENNPNKDFENLITQICEHNGFQETIKIAQAENAGNVKQLDGSAYPEEKLVVRFRGFIVWLYHLWLSLPASNKEQPTDKVYRLLFGYFQLDNWCDNFKACCAELGAQMVRDSVENSGDKEGYTDLSDHAMVLAAFAASSTQGKPQSLKDAPPKTAETVSVLLRRESIWLRESMVAQCKGEKTAQEPTLTMWQGLYNLYTRPNYIDLRMTLLVIELYSGVASVDFTVHEKATPDLQKTFKKMQMVHKTVEYSLKILAELRWSGWKQFLDNLDTLYSMLKLVCHPLDNIRIAALKALTAHLIGKPTIAKAFSQMYDASPQKFLTVFNTLLDNYNDYAFQHDTVVASNAVVPLNDILLPLTQALTGRGGYLEKMAATRNPERAGEQSIVKHFWKASWKAVDLVFVKALRWAETLSPSTVLACINPMFDIAATLTSSRSLFQNAINAVSQKQSETACRLEYDVVNTAVDSISQWIFLNRESVFKKLVSLLTNMLHELQLVHLKISVESYERLMGAVVGSSSTLMTTEDKQHLFIDDKKQLFTALSAHEPANNIYLQDSSDEEIIEWQTVDTTSRASPQRFSPSPTPPKPSTTTGLKPILRQAKLEHAFSRASEVSGQNTRQKITTYFASTNKQLEEAKQSSRYVAEPEPEPEQKPMVEDMPMNIDQVNDEGAADDYFDDFDDFDFSQIPDDWFDAKDTTGAAEQQDLSPRSDPTAFGGRLSSTASTPSTSKKKLSSMAEAIQKQWQQQQEARQQASKKVMHPAATPTQQGPRFVPQATKPTTYAVTSTGRKLKPPSMGFSKMKALREEFRAERRLTAATKAPSAMATSSQKRKHQDDGSSSDSSSSDDEGGSSGLSELVKDMTRSKEAIEAEKASMRALFEAPKKRSIKLLENPDAQLRTAKKMKMQIIEQRRKRVTPDIQRLYKSILSWDVTSNTEVPPDTPTSIYTKVPDKFTSYQDYISVFEPLLLLEVWMQLLRSREMLNENDIVDRCILHERCHVSDFVDLTFEVSISAMNTFLQDDLICVANHFGADFFRRSDTKITSMRPGGYFLGKVQSTSQRQGIASITVRTFFPPDRITLLNSLSPKSSWRIVRMFSLTTAQREYAALQGMEHYELAKDILEPRPSPMPKVTEKNIHRLIRKYGLNEPQAEAISGALDKKRGFTLIQGPPGTGKTKTILGLIVSLLEEQKQPTNAISIGPDTSNRGAKNKIMVCAPSNAAVDEIAKRLQEGVSTVYGVVRPNVVRVGTIEGVNASVKDLLLDRLIEKEMELSAQDKETSKGFAKRRDALADQVRKLQLDIDDIERKLSECTDRNQMYSLRDKQKELINQRNKTKTMIKSVYEEQKDYNRDLEVSRLRARQQVFNRADVVCCTLSSSGHENLTSAGLTFETVIVDEAAQSIEISSLIPLKYDCKRCILVGDPNQLPPTVLSLLAAKYSYEQSLFVRLQKNAPDNVYLLSIQYRMHPEISRFPSKLFYNARLLDGPDMALATKAPWHSLRAFPPYCFYNVEEGVEKSGSGQSFYNSAEAEAAVTLVDLLAARLPDVKFAYRIGIITPYKQQLSQLKSRFEKRYGPKVLQVIDFNTVDGFQGQEKDIIIFSCVRAGSDRGIGFLSDIRRMNVGLTRAKCSLLVLGHKQSLLRNEYWRELVEDAKSRRLLVNIRAPYFDHRLTTGKPPANLFEMETRKEGKKYRLSSSKSTARPMEISVPVAEDTNDNRSIGSNNNNDNTDTGSARRKDCTTLAEVTSSSADRDTEMAPGAADPKEKKPAAGSPQRPDRGSPENNNSVPKQQQNAVPPTRPQRPPAPQRLTLAQYRASLGQPPINSSAANASLSSGSRPAGSSGLLRRPPPNIYINKKPKTNPAPRRPPHPPHPRPPPPS